MHFNLQNYTDTGLLLSALLLMGCGSETKLDSQIACDNAFSYCVEQINMTDRGNFIENCTDYTAGKNIEALRCISEAKNCTGVRACGFLVESIAEAESTTNEDVELNEPPRSGATSSCSSSHWECNGNLAGHCECEYKSPTNGYSSGTLDCNWVEQICPDGYHCDRGWCKGDPFEGP